MLRWQVFDHLRDSSKRVGAEDHSAGSRKSFTTSTIALSTLAPKFTSRTILIMYVRPGWVRAVVVFAIRAENSADYIVRHSKMATGDRFLPAAQRRDWHCRPPFTVSFSFRRLTQVFEHLRDSSEHVGAEVDSALRGPALHRAGGVSRVLEGLLQSHGQAIELLPDCVRCDG